MNSEGINKASYIKGSELFLSLHVLDIIKPLLCIIDIVAGQKSGREVPRNDITLNDTLFYKISVLCIILKSQAIGMAIED